MNNENIIKLAKLEFEKSFLERNYYNIQTQDDDHLDRIVEAINVSNKKRILDLGTGSGYLGFKIASEFKDSLITGLDIVTQTLKENTNEALKRGISNIDFIDYDGEIFPFKDNTFDIIVTCYTTNILKYLIECYYSAICIGRRYFTEGPGRPDNVVNLSKMQK